MHRKTRFALIASTAFLIAVGANLGAATSAAASQPHNTCSSKAACACAGKRDRSTVSATVPSKKKRRIPGTVTATDTPIVLETGISGIDGTKPGKGSGANDGGKGGGKDGAG